MTHRTWAEELSWSTLRRRLAVRRMRKKKSRAAAAKRWLIALFNLGVLGGSCRPGTCQDREKTSSASHAAARGCTCTVFRVMSTADEQTF